MSSKHTPGPWIVRNHYGSVGTPNKLVAAVYGDDPEYKPDAAMVANAHLIAVAPDLLEFAKEVRRSGDTRLAGMAIAIIAKAEVK